MKLLKMIVLSQTKIFLRKNKRNLNFCQCNLQLDLAGWVQDGKIIV